MVSNGAMKTVLAFGSCGTFPFITIMGTKRKQTHWDLDSILTVDW